MPFGSEAEEGLDKGETFAGFATPKLQDQKEVFVSMGANNPDLVARHEGIHELTGGQPVYVEDATGKKQGYGTEYVARAFDYLRGVIDQDLDLISRTEKFVADRTDNKVGGYTLLKIAIESIPQLYKKGVFNKDKATLDTAQKVLKQIDKDEQSFIDSILGKDPEKVESPVVTSEDPLYAMGGIKKGDPETLQNLKNLISILPFSEKEADESVYTKSYRITDREGLGLAVGGAVAFDLAAKPKKETIISRDVNVVGNLDEDGYNALGMRQGGGVETEAGQKMESKAFKLNREKADLNKDGELSSYEKARGEAIQKSMVAEMNCGGMMADPFAPMNVIVGMDGVSGNDIPAGSMAHEVRDDIPAMLSEGEYVVPADVVRWHGLKTFESLRGEAKMAMGLMAEHGRMSFVDEDTKEPVEYEEEEYEDDDDIENENVEIEEAEVKVVHAAEGTSVEPTSPQTFYRYVTRLNPATGRYEFVAVDPTTGQQVAPDQFDPARSTRYTPENVLGQVYQKEPECPEGYRYDAETGACVPVEPVTPPVSVTTPTVSGGDGDGPPDVATPQYSERLGTRIAERLGPLSAEDLANFEGATLAEQAYGRMTDARPISLGRAALAALSGPMGILGLGAKSLYDEVGASRAALTRANEISGIAAGLDATALPRTYNFTFDPNTSSFKATSSTQITELQEREGGGSWVTDYEHTDKAGNKIDPFASDEAFESWLEGIEEESAALPTATGGGRPTVPVTDLSTGRDEPPAPTPVEQTPTTYSPVMDSESDNDNDNNNGGGFDGWGGGGYDNWSGDDESVGYGYNKGGYVARKNTPKIALLKR
jgi:hypothetical protein